MRIQKGCIEINSVKDVALLRQVLHSQLVTHEQLWAFMRLRLYEFKRHSFNWRVRRLVESGLLARHSKLPYTESYVYSLTNAGADVLISHGEWFPMLTDEHGRKERVSVAHTLGLNDLQLSLIREHILESWKPELMIRFESQYLANPHAKDYDAIVTVRIDYRESVFNLEYERTTKRYSDYANIRELFEQETNLKPVLYVIPDFELLRVLRHAFRGTSAPVFICLAGDFADSFMEMKLTDASSGVVRRIAAIL
jgi:Replication-relaxation